MSPARRRIESPAALGYERQGEKHGASKYWTFGSTFHASIVMCMIHTNIGGDGYEAMKSADIIKKLKRDGWELVRIKGDHHHFEHASKPGLVTVPHPTKDIPIGTLASIEKQAGWR